MLLNDFPDLQWIRKQARSNFDERKDAQGNKLPKSGWPSVILNTKAEQGERDGILGPFSLFFNLSGQSVIRTDRQAHQVNDDFYYVSNHGQEYDLHIPQDGQTETFNIHFGEQLYQDVLTSQGQTPIDLLDLGPAQKAQSLELCPKLHFKSVDFHSKVAPLIGAAKDMYDMSWSTEREYELLAELLAYVIDHNTTFLRKNDLIESAKRSTQTELLRRICIAIDYLHDHAPKEVALDELSRASSLSKFHLLRIFKQVMGCTPQQYLGQLRVHRALHLLKQPSLTPTEISSQLGFSELPAFTRFIKRHAGISPKQYQANLRISNLG
ncbi:MAG: AraC family transcriptional regulator [Cyclobacteriaceae bacterium]